ncbi:MAG: hypothetical protein JSS10_06315 [Verrucomicrobia bacterium]|nr:hypothetical protein [Verrucomicrobiota bacterium]
MAIRPSARAHLAPPARTSATPRFTPKSASKVKIQMEVAAAASRSLRQPVVPAPALTASRAHAEAPAAARQTPTPAPRQAAPVAQPSRAPAAAPAAPARSYTVVSAAPAKAKKKSEEQKAVELFGTSRKEALVSKATKKTPSLLNKLTQPKMLCLMGALGALKVGFAVLAVKVGPLAATSLVAQHTIAFLTPGVYVMAFAMEVALKLTTTVIAHGILPIVLPILSTVVVTTLAVGLTVYAGYLILQTMKKKVCALLDKLPLGAGDVAKSMLFGDENAKEKASSKSAFSTALSFVTGLVSSSKTEVDADGDADASDDESSDEEIDYVRMDLEGAAKAATATANEQKLRADLGMGPVVRPKKGFEALLEAAETPNPHILTRYKSLQI